MRLPDTAIRRPVFAVMLVGGLVVLGVISASRLGLDLFPRVEFPLVTVTTVLEGAAPETVEREVTQVLEESINTIEGIRLLRSASSESLSLLFIEFELEYDVSEKAQEVRDKISAVRAELPREIDPPIVDRVDPDSTPILAVMVAGPDSIRSLSEYADKRIKPRLERIAGVGSIELVGDRPREVRIWIDPVRLSGYSLAVDDVLAAVQREHVELPGGRIETHEREYTIKTRGKLTSADLFGDIVVFERAGRVVHLRDVAMVEDGMAEERTTSHLNGRRGVALLIRRQSGENTVAVADAVKAELARIRAQMPPGYEMIEAMDSSRFIRSSVRDVASDLAWGALLAAAVVLLFLRNVRSTFITAVIIPASLLGTLTFFYFFGFTLNTMTLMALSLSIGGLIDDAIVLLENTYRHMEAGEKPRQAASRATDEIGLAVFATNLTNCAVFIPIAFMGGVVGRFFREFGLVATGAVLVSTLIALTWTPMLCSRFLRLPRRQARVYRLLEAGYGRLEAHYRRVLAWGLHHRAAVIGLALASVVAGIFVARNLPLDFMGIEDRSEFNVWLKTTPGSTVAQTHAAVRAVETELRRRPEVHAVFSTIGAGVQKRVNEAQLYVQLVHKNERHASQTEIMHALRRRVAEMEIPVTDYAVEEVPLFRFPGGRNAQIMYAIRGPDIDQLQLFARNLTARMRDAGGFADLTVSYETGKPEISLEIARERAANLAVPALQIAQTISALVAGIKVTTFEERGERYDVRVQVRPEYRDDVSKLDLVKVRAPSGVLVPLRNLVTVHVGSGPVQIDRDSRTRAVTILGNLDGKAAGVADEEVVHFGRGLGIDGEYELEAVGPTQRLRETIAAIGFAFAVALVAMYMILAAQFNSFIHPFTIMLCAPLSFIGAFAAVAVSGISLDLMGQIAFLMLMGVVMKNGILLVDYTNTLRARGRSLYEAAMEASATRMRPVLMTTVSTICGMLPVALSTGDGSEWRAPMGIISIGGLATSTFLTLLVVPVVYTLFDDGASRSVRMLRSMRARFGAWRHAPAPGAVAEAQARAAKPEPREWSARWNVPARNLSRGRTASLDRNRRLRETGTREGSHTMDFAVPEEIDRLCESIHAFMHEYVYPLERFRDAGRLEIGGPAYPPVIRAVQAKAKELGYWAFHLPKEAGGAGLPFMHYVFVNEIFGRSPAAPVCFGSQAPDSGNAEILWRYGTEEQKARWLKPLVDGEIRSCFSMTEPEVAGSDPRLLRTTAVRHGDDYIINGHKWFSSGAHGAAFAIVMALTNPEQENAYLRFSQIIVPTDAPGFRIARGIPVMGDDDNHHAEIWYENCRVPVTNRLGGEGMGFVIAQDRLGPGRIHHCMRWLGMAQRGFELMCRYANQREMFGSTLARKSNIQDWIAESRAEIQAARLLTLHAAWKIDTAGSGGAREEISLIKFYGARMLHSVIDKAIQVFGAAGVTEDHPLSYFYRQARLARIYDGPDEVHKMVVARRILAAYATS